MPAFGARGQHAVWLKVGRWGDFGQNLAAISGIVALLVGVRGFVTHNHHLRQEKRWLLLLFSLIFVTTIGAATLNERTAHSGELVWLALGEANVLCVVLSVSVLGLAAGRGTRALSLAAACMALFGLTARVMERLALAFGGLASSLRDVFEAVGEVGYLAVLLLGALWVVPRGTATRAGLARLVGMMALGMVAASFVLGQMGPVGEFKLVLYNAQRVRLLLDHAPALYAIPTSVAVGAAVAAVLGADPVRRQAGVGLLLLLASGYAPRAPAGLLTLTLSICVLARAAVAAAWQLGPTAQPPAAPAAPATPATE